MAYDFNKIKNAWDQMDEKQRAHASKQYANNADFQKFQQDLSKGSLTDSMQDTQQKYWTSWPNTWSITPNTNSITATGNNKVTTGNSNYTPIRREWDTFGDSWYASEKNQYQWSNTTGSAGFVYNKNYNTSNLPSDMKFGNNAMSPGGWYLTTRNNNLAMAFFNEWKTDRNDIYNYLMQYEDFKNFDDVWRWNTVDAISKRIWNFQKEYGNTQQTTPTTSKAENRGDIWILGTDDTNPGGWDYLTRVNEIAISSLGHSLEELKAMYPEQYDDMMDYIMQWKGVRDATPADQRKELDANIQRILWVGAGTGSDMSTLKRYEEAVGTKFNKPDLVAQDMQKVLNLQTRGLTTEEIAKQLNMPPDQVTQLILLANGDTNSRAWDYYSMTDVASKQVTEDIDRKRAKLEQDKNRALDKANEDVARLKEDFDTNFERQKKQNDIQNQRAHWLASKYWFAYSDQWLQWLQYVWEQAQNILDDLVKNYERGNKDLADGISDIIRNWQWNNDNLIRDSENALRDAKNLYLSKMVWIQQKYWIYGQQAQQMYANAVQSMIEQAEKIYNDALTRQQQNLTTMINSAMNLNTLQMQDYTMKQNYYKEFKDMASTMTSWEVQQYAEKYWLEYDTLMAYQVANAQNILNGAQSGAWLEYADQLKNYVNWWYSPYQAVQTIMNTAEFKAKYPNAKLSGINWGILYDKDWKPVEQYWVSNWVLYNKYTWTSEYVGKDANSNELPAYIKTVKGSDWREYIIDLSTNTVVDPESIAKWQQSAPTTQYGMYNGTLIDNNWNVIQLSDLMKDPNTKKIVDQYQKDAWEMINKFISDYGVDGKTDKQKWDWWGQCGTFANDYLNSLWVEWRVFGSTLEQKMKAITPWVDKPIVGAIVIMDTWAKTEDWKPAGHVGIVTRINSDGTFMVTDSNWWKDEKVRTHKVNPNSSQIKWYYVPWYSSIWQMAWDALNQNAQKNVYKESYYWGMDIGTLTHTMFWWNASEGDRKIMEKAIEDWKKLWKTYSEIMYDVGWYRINDDADRNFAEWLKQYMEKNVAKNSQQIKIWVGNTYNLNAISNRINAGDYAGAIQAMETQLYDQFGWWQEGDNMALAQKLSRLYDDVQSLDWKYLWPVDKVRGTIEQWISDIMDKGWSAPSQGEILKRIQAKTDIEENDVKKLTSVLSQVQNIYSTIRNRLAGTAVTENETKWLQDMLPSIWDTWVVFSVKLKESMNNLLQDVNWFRKSRWLPELQNLNQYLDWWERAKLYWGTARFGTTWNKIQ